MNIIILNKCVFVFRLVLTSKKLMPPVTLHSDICIVIIVPIFLGSMSP